MENIGIQISINIFIAISINIPIQQLDIHLVPVVLQIPFHLLVQTPIVPHV
jgi:hypothetical protein